MKRKKIGLALGSGGIRGLAHIGVIKVLEKNNIPIDFIAGSSAGAFFGGLYAALGNSKSLEKLVFSMKWKQILSLIDPSFKGGLIRGKKIQEFIEQIVGKTLIEELKIPFSAVATDFKTGEKVVISKGKLSTALLASGAFPLIVKPVKWKNHLLLDGGLSDPIPVDVVKKMGADLTIAVDLDSKFYPKQNAGRAFPSKIVRCIEILRHHLAQSCSQTADIWIAPEFSDLKLKEKIKIFGKTGKKIVQIGERACEEIVPEIKKR